MVSGKCATTPLILQAIESAEFMLPVYIRLRTRARQIAARLPEPVFYRQFSWAISLSLEIMENTPFVGELRKWVSDNIEDDFGHGLKHSIKVAEDAGALVLIESRALNYPDKDTHRRVIIALCAGLLHDIKRKHKNHAVAGAVCAADLLKRYPLTAAEIEDVCLAIRNHEAFKPTEKAASSAGAMISDCLYDADKFRWGPDNFTDTVWSMVGYLNPPLDKFIRHYPRGMDNIAAIRHTFRSATGKKYGPAFIDLGLAIGRELFQVINSEFKQTS